jgi:hypothetical protein
MMCPYTVSVLLGVSKKSPMAYGCLIEELNGNANGARHLFRFVEPRGVLLVIAKLCALV